MNTSLDHTIINMLLLSTLRESIVASSSDILSQSMFNKETQLVSQSINFSSNLI